MINNDKNRLFLYITISLIIHLLLFYFFPFGYLEGFSNQDAQGENFGYVQLVKYQSNSNKEVEKQNETTQKKEIKEEPKPEEKPKKDKEEPITKTEEEDVQIKEEVITEKTDKEIDNEQEQKVEKKANEETETVNNQEQEVITSEESDSKIEVKQEKSNKDQEKTAKTQEVEEEPKPPPPPTAGELIGLSPKPVYPKYLVSEARSGEVGLNVTIDQNGEIENLVITKSSNIDSMDRNAKLTVEKGWQFKTYKQRYQIDVTVIFNIDDSGNPNVDVQIGNVNFL